jgi:superfamily I DNA/RNA helicase
MPWISTIFSSRPVDLFDKSRPLAERYSTRFAYIMVDEYQDTNRQQYRLVRHLATCHDNICVVGDEDQSIYSWRGADIQNILSFEKDFPPRPYRSTRAELPFDEDNPRCGQHRRREQ